MNIGKNLEHSIIVGGKTYYISQNVKERVDAMSKEDIEKMIKFASSIDELFLGDNYNYLMMRFKLLNNVVSEKVCGKG